jgi:putative membrane protein
LHRPPPGHKQEGEERRDMQFLKTLFWVALAIILVLFATKNWEAVTLNLWGGLQADVKKPVLIIVPFLLGFLPTFLIYRARLWSLRRRYEPTEQGTVVVTPPLPGRAVTSAPDPAPPESRVDAPDSAVRTP